MLEVAVLSALLVCLASVIAYLAYLASGSYFISSAILLSSSALEALESVTLFASVEQPWVLAFAYASGIGLAYLAVLLRAWALRRSSRLYAIVGNVRVYVTSSPRILASTFAPMSCVFISRATLLFLAPQEVDAAIMHEVGHRSSGYRWVHLAVSLLVSLTAASSLGYAIETPSLFSVACAAAYLYSCFVAAKSSSWIFEHEADRFAARKGYAYELCTSLAKIATCSKLREACFGEAMLLLENPQTLKQMARSRSVLKDVAELLKPLPNLHPPTETRIHALLTSLAV